MLTAVVIVAVAGLLPLGWFVQRELSKGRRFFKAIAAQFDGYTTTIPFGAVIQPGNTRIRVYALQGSIHCRAKVRLNANPGILVTRKIAGLRVLDRLNYAPGRTQFRFRAPVDEHYGFRAKEQRWMRGIFSEQLQARMISSGRVTRIEVKQRAIYGTFLMLNHSENERQKARESINILNQLVEQVLRSTLTDGS